jgi:hypothetical protein
MLGPHAWHNGGKKIEFDAHVERRHDKPPSLDGLLKTNGAANEMILSSPDLVGQVYPQGRG